MAASASFSPEFEPSEKDMPNVDKFVKLKPGDVLFQWQAAVAILEDEYKGTGRAVLDQSRYEFASHLLDIHRMWCRACPRFVPGSLPERLDRDTAGAGSAALSRQSQQKGETQTTDGISGLQSDAPITKQDDSIEDFDRKDNMIETDMTCPSQDDELQGDGNTASTDKSLNVIDIIIKQEEVDDESIHDYEEEQRLDGWIEADTNQHLADVEMAMHSNPSSSTLGSEDTSRVRCDTGMDSRDNLQNTSRFDENQSYMSTQDPSHQKPYQCSECMKRFTLKGNLKKHMRNHSGETPYQCSLCDKAFKSSSHFTYHMRTHTGEKPYQCSVCSKAFKQSGELIGHMRTHTGEKPYQCSVCNKAFSTNSNLSSHMRIHTGEKPYECSECLQRFTKKEHLKLHIRSHTGEKPYQCLVCNKAFALSSNLSCHMRTHTGDRPYKCPVCSKAFSQNGNLVYHMRTHTGERPYQCSACDKTFKDSGHLSRHMRTHTGERPYQCAECEQRFIQKEHLKIHMRSHNGEKPFQCSVCNKAFTRSSGLTSHMKLHRGEKP